MSSNDKLDPYGSFFIFVFYTQIYPSTRGQILSMIEKSNQIKRDFRE